MTQHFNFTIITVLCLTLTSCAGSLKEEGWRDSWNSGVLHYGSSTGPSRTIGNTGTLYKTSGVGDEEEKAYTQHVTVDNLEYLKKMFPSKKAKYERKLQKLISKMQKERTERYQRRMNFLKTFYTDLNKADGKTLSRKYKKHCYYLVYNPIKKRNKQLGRNTKEDIWKMFSDGERHKEEELSFSHLDSNHTDNENEAYVRFMFGDETQRNKDTIPYCDADQKWYKVSMGKNIVMVKLTGMSKNIKITGLINPARNIAIK